MCRIICALIPCIFLSVSVTAQTGPAGVGASDGTSTLIFWLDANRSRVGVTPVTSWLDLSGRNVATNVLGNPSFVASTLNGFGAVRFDGVGDEITTNTTINAVTYPSLTVITVYVPRVNFSGSVWGEDNGEWDRFLTDINLLATLNQSVGAGYDPGSTAHPCNHIPGLFVSEQTSICTAVYREDLFNGTQVRVNGNLNATFTSTAADYQTTGYSNLHVGAIGSNGFTFDGDIAEVIVFGNALTNTEQLLVENYLSAKYNVPMTNVASDIYNEDNLGFDYDVAGIGRINNQSQSTARGTGIVQVTAAGTIGENQFLVWGHDNGVLQATNAMDIPSGVVARSNRVWAVSEMNTAQASVDAGAVNIAFDLSGLGSITASDLRLLVDADADGLFSDETPYSGFVASGGNVYTISNVTALTDNSRFTFATANAAQTPLPIQLETFTVDAMNDVVYVSWTTVQEINNEYFEIARSKDARVWEMLARIDGQHTTNSGHDYVFVDHFPLEGQSYYRLAQSDLNGESTTVGLKAVMVDGAPEVYPNPFGDFLMLRMTQTDFQIFDTMGAMHTNEVSVIEQTETGALLNTRNLPTGEYVIIGGKYPARIIKR